MADLNQLRQKYQPVLDLIQKEGARVEALDLQGDQLHLRAVADSDASKNRIWDAIKSVDPNFSDLKHEIVVQEGERMYVVQPGDNLSKISKHFYGDANKYNKIAQANSLDDPDRLKAGMQLKIPA